MNHALLPDEPIDIRGRRRVDVIRETWSFARATTKGLTERQWTAVAIHPDTGDVGGVARLLATRLADAVNGQRRPARERLDATEHWTPFGTAAEIRRRAATIVAFWRNIPESGWTVPRRSGLSVLEGTERLAFETCVLLTAMLPPLGMEFDPPCLPLAHRFALDELDEYGTGRLRRSTVMSPTDVILLADLRRRQAIDRQPDSEGGR